MECIVRIFFAVFMYVPFGYGFSFLFKLFLCKYEDLFRRFFDSLYGSKLKFQKKIILFQNIFFFI